MTSFVNEGFSLLTPQIFARGTRPVPEAPGVYALLLRGADRALRSAGYAAAVRCQPWNVDGYIHLYTGESYNLRGRIQEHLAGTPGQSGSFQPTLLALQYAHTSLWEPADVEDEDEMVSRLHGLLSSNLLIAFKRTALCGDVEADIIRRSGSPLNITARPADAFTRTLKNLRQEFRRAGFAHLFEARKTSSAARPYAARACPSPLAHGAAVASSLQGL